MLSYRIYYSNCGFLFKKLHVFGIKNIRLEKV